MTRVLVLQPDPLCPPALVREELEAAGVELTVRQFDGDDVTPEDMKADGLLLLGGPQSVLDEKHAALMAGLQNAVRSFHARNLPILGICLGAQVMSIAMGGAVDRHERLQFGFKTFSYSDAAESDRVLQGVDMLAPVFCWHEDHIRPPRDAVLLAAGDSVPLYAFRVAEKAYGFQYHFEVTGQSLAAMLERGLHLVPKNLGEEGVARAEAIHADIDRHLERAISVGRNIANNWARMVSDSGNRAV